MDFLFPFEGSLANEVGFPNQRNPNDVFFLEAAEGLKSLIWTLTKEGAEIGGLTLNPPETQLSEFGEPYLSCAGTFFLSKQKEAYLLDRENTFWISLCTPHHSHMQTRESGFIPRKKALFLADPPLRIMRALGHLGFASCSTFRIETPTDPCSWRSTGNENVTVLDYFRESVRLLRSIPRVTDLTNFPGFTIALKKPDQQADIHCNAAPAPLPQKPTPLPQNPKKSTRPQKKSLLLSFRHLIERNSKK